MPLPRSIDVIRYWRAQEFDLIVSRGPAVGRVTTAANWILGLRYFSLSVFSKIGQMIVFEKDAGYEVQLCNKLSELPRLMIIMLLIFRQLCQQ